jgi:hypothetical protein
MILAWGFSIASVDMKVVQVEEDNRLMADNSVGIDR